MASPFNGIQMEPIPHTFAPYMWFVVVVDDVEVLFSFFWVCGEISVYKGNVNLLALNFIYSFVFTCIYSFLFLKLIKRL